MYFRRVGRCGRILDTCLTDACPNSLTGPGPNILTERASCSRLRHAYLILEQQLNPQPLSPKVRLDCSSSLPSASPSYHLSYPTSPFFVLHWLVQPFRTLSDILPQPPTPSPNTLFRPTLDCSAILPYATPSYHNLLRPALVVSPNYAYHTLLRPTLVRYGRLAEQPNDPVTIQCRTQTNPPSTFVVLPHWIVLVGRGSLR